MDKKDIKVGDIMYWNTTGAFGKYISLACKVVDKGKFIWIHVFGNLAYNNLLWSELTKEPLYEVTNKRLLNQWKDSKKFFKEDDNR